MTDHTTKLAQEFKAFDHAEGVDAYVTVVPSAAGMPLPSKLSPEDSLAHSKAVFAAAGEALDADVALA